MKILQLTYYDKKINWRLSPIHFSNLNLLVGISGVGKTQILKSIINLRSIARGYSLNGAVWDVEFSINNNIYKWKGEFEHINQNLLPTSSLNNQFKIINEYLYLNNKLIIERDITQIKFKDDKLSKLSSFTSAVNILNEEEDIYPVAEAFNNIYNQNYLPIQIKLSLAYKHQYNIFKEIKHQFINIFEHVEDIRIQPDDHKINPEVISVYPVVEIKEKGINSWIKQNEISSGMLKTLMHISELYLSADGTVILIDEFENSLDVNCINILTDLLIENRRIQFIITSHHPYIINKLAMEHGKIITRQGNIVTAKDIKEYNLSKSRHQAFMQLINLNDYREGILVESI